MKGANRGITPRLGVRKGCTEEVKAELRSVGACVYACDCNGGGGWIAGLVGVGGRLQEEKGLGR